MKKSSLSVLKPAQIERAITNLQQLTANSPTPEVYFDLGYLYYQQQQWQPAIASYRKAIALKPNFPEAHLQLGAVLTQSGNEDLAANHLFKAYQLQPDLVTAQDHYELGQTLQKQNKPARAIACYRGAIKFQPDFRTAYDSLAWLLKAQGKNQRAIEAYRQGVKNNPQNPDYYLALALALAAQQKWVRACNNYQQAAQLKPTADIFYHWGLALIELEKYDLAQTYWQQAIALESDYAPAYYQLGCWWQQQKQWQKAIHAYKQFIALDSQPQSALVNLGTIYRYLKQYDLSIACYQAGIKHIAQGSTLETEAFAGYQETLAAAPEVTVSQYYQLGKLLRSRSRFAAAITAYCESIKLDPYFKPAYIDLQYTPIAQQQSNKLIDFYRQIVTKHQDLTIAWGNLGDALTKQERIPEAIECYRQGSYQKAVQTYPHLAKLSWQPEKKSAPDFIIAGASKSGTSSIYYYLSRHPQVLLPHKKELDFYWTNYQLGLEWYLAHFPTITDRPDFLTGEATPNYLRFPQVAQRIKDTFPQTKIIILLRNPVDRAISWHYHKLNTGLTRVDLKTAIATEIERLASVTEAEITNTGFYEPDNIISSLYIYKIKPWIELLGREQLLILKSEEFYLNPLDKMKSVFKFLDLPNCPLENYPKVNAGSYERVDPSLRKTLSEYFAPYNQQLEEYLNLELGWK